MSNVREKSGHVTFTLFGNIAFISNRINDIIIRTCRNMLNGFECEKKKKGDKRRRKESSTTKGSFDRRNKINGTAQSTWLPYSSSPWPFSCCWTVPVLASRIPPASPEVLRGLVRRPIPESTDDTAEKQMMVCKVRKFRLSGLVLFILNRHAGDLRRNQKDLGMASWIRKNAGLVGIFQMLLILAVLGSRIDR